MSKRFTERYEKEVFEAFEPGDLAERYEIEKGVRFMVFKQEYCDVNFWFAVEDAGLTVEDVAQLIVEVPKTPQIVSIVAERNGKRFIFTNFGSHIDCLVEGVIMKRLYRLLKQFLIAGRSLTGFCFS